MGIPCGRIFSTEYEAYFVCFISSPYLGLCFDYRGDSDRDRSFALYEKEEKQEARKTYEGNGPPTF